MKKAKTILALIGEQRIPNAIPFRHFTPGSFSRVEMVYSAKTRAAAISLKNWLELEQISVPIDPETGEAVRNVNDFEYQVAVLNSILEKYPSGEVVVNLTGGTKIMSLAAAQVARDHDIAAIYVDTESNLLWHVHPQARKEPLNVRFNVSDFLLLHGQPTNELTQPEPELQQVSEDLRNNFRDLSSLVQKLRMESCQRFTLDSPSQKELLFLKSCVRNQFIRQLPETMAEKSPPSWER